MEISSSPRGQDPWLTRQQIQDSNDESKEHHDPSFEGFPRSNLDDRWIEPTPPMSPLKQMKTVAPPRPEKSGGCGLCRLVLCLPFWLFGGISLIIMGVLKKDECPVQEDIPYCSIIYGCLLILFALTSFTPDVDPKLKIGKNLLSILKFVTILLIVIATITFAIITLHRWQPNFENLGSADYCHKHMYLLLTAYLLIVLILICALFMLFLIFCCGLGMVLCLDILKRRSKRKKEVFREQRRLKIEAGNHGKSHIPKIEPNVEHKNSADLLRRSSNGSLQDFNKSLDSFIYI